MADVPDGLSCDCSGRARSDMLSPEPRFGFWRSMTLLFGVTAAPMRIDYVCMACGKTVGSSRDADVLRKHTQ